jgi:hypothetical protein
MFVPVWVDGERWLEEKTTERERERERVSESERE